MAAFLKIIRGDDPGIRFDRRCDLCVHYTLNYVNVTLAIIGYLAAGGRQSGRRNRQVNAAGAHSEQGIDDARLDVYYGSKALGCVGYPRLRADDEAARGGCRSDHAGGQYRQDRG